MGGAGVVWQASSGGLLVDGPLRLRYFQVVYWRATQYEELAGRPRVDQVRIIRAAIANHGRNMNRRFYCAVAIVVGNIGLAGHLFRDRPPFDWRPYVFVASAAVLFSVYLLWEINGPVRLAVAKYLIDKEHVAGPDHASRSRSEVFVADIETDPRDEAD
jgi:hypothetical protein